MPIRYQGSENTRLALDAFVKLSRAADSLHNLLSRKLEKTGLTLSQFGVLEALYHLGPMRQCHLAHKLLKSGGNLTRVIDNLERDGLVKRHREKADRRAYQIHLTPKGKKLIAEIFPQHAEEIRKQFSSLESTEQQQLAQLCRRLGTSLLSD